MNSFIDIDPNEITEICNQYAGIENEMHTMGCSPEKMDIPSFFDVSSDLESLYNNKMKMQNAIESGLNDIKTFLVDDVINKLEDSDNSIKNKMSFGEISERLSYQYDYGKDLYDKGLPYLKYKRLVEGALKDFDVNIIIEELNYIYDNRGKKAFEGVINYLLRGRPKNYNDNQFRPRPGGGLRNELYDFDLETIDNYEKNSEGIDIASECWYDFVQVLPEDCTDIERIAYDYFKANIINTMRALPESFQNTVGGNGTKSTVILTSDSDSQDHKGNWAGYYCPGLFYDAGGNVVVLMALEDFHNGIYFSDINAFYTRDVIIHELSHCFDDNLEGLDLTYEDLLNGRNYSTGVKTEAWKGLYDKYHQLLPDVLWNGYEDYKGSVVEFFADAMNAYFVNPDRLKELCDEELYNAITEALGGDYGGYYTNNIDSVLDTPYKRSYD